MAVLTIDTGKKTGRIKPLHGGGQPPIDGRGTDDFTVLAEAGIPYSRLHDCGGNFGDGLYVDVPNIFREFRPLRFHQPAFSSLLLRLPNSTMRVLSVKLLAIPREA